MNRQQIFDTAVTALLKQGAPAYDQDTMRCLYRGPNGTKCAVGHLIPDDRYDPSIEDNSADTEEVLTTLKGIVDPRSTDFITQLQRCHDAPAENHPLSEWLEHFESNARDFAKRFGLNAKVLGAC